MVDIRELMEVPCDESCSNHSKSFEEVIKVLDSNSELGLSNAKAERLLKQYGRNELKGQGAVNPWKILLAQVANGLTAVLTIAMVVSFAVKDYGEGGVLVLVIAFNTIVGFMQEYRAEKTMDALRKMASPSAKVIREGIQQRISSTDVVPGDVLTFEVGDIIPADCRLMEVLNLEVDEALLTGESVPSIKLVEPILGKDVSIGDRINMVYSSTTVAKGRGRAIVASTGMSTEIGKISNAINETPAQLTLLQRRLNMMAYVLMVIALILALIVFAVNKFDFNTEIIIYAIALAIGVIPEGLIAVITIVQALGVRRMAKQHALVRKLVALESLQAVTNICSDKTGTLTQGKMVVTNVWFPGHDSEYIISGQGYETKGDISAQGRAIATETALEDLNFRKLVECCALCNTANIVEASEGNVWGDPTEIALQVFAYKMQMGKPILRKTKKPVEEFPFSSDTKRMSMVYLTKLEDVLEVYSKGAEVVLTICDDVMERTGNLRNISEDGEFMKNVTVQQEEMAKQGLRVLVIAYRQESERAIGKPVCKWKREDVESNLTFLGLVGIRDTPRIESKESVSQCHQAGITVHMLTGDHKATALSIAREVGILEPLSASKRSTSKRGVKGDAHVVPMSSSVMTATEFDPLSEKEVDALDELPLVIARCTPSTKVRMIDALHRRKKYAAMTGDGVNDAPSLKKADVGIAMGAGSDVAKTSSEIVLTDNNFATIVQAVAEGRRIFSNIKKFVVHLLSTNVGQVIVLLGGLAFKDGSGMSVFPLSPVQILFLNLITGTPPAMALGIERASSTVMQVRPYLKGLFTNELIADILVYGTFTGVLALLNWVLVIYAFGNGDLGSQCNTSSNLGACVTVFRARATVQMAFTWMILFHAYNCRHLRASLFTTEGGGRSRFFANKLMVASVFLGAVVPVPTLYIPVLNTGIFKQEGLTWEWILVGITMVVFFLLSEFYKLLKRRFITTPYTIGLLIQCWVSHGLFLVFVSIWIEAQHHSNTAWSRVITRDEEFLVQLAETIGEDAEMRDCKSEAEKGS
ncbi:sodium/potassium exporting P-type ATPase 1-like isoform X2 [Physcomitrium patens]|uniref:sodium/potassium exporting P-type ATPase 1-like isoform X2 n=1 Tax=Physcomitrium patens TaxID=3218 RepID=UPI000D16C539|nr:calcium-transporting ATPase 3-like isoform X2 [Physcomitrium patens]|eukprot:XP_024364260.1 calcium-transporting ATPase 3-like isoform X2 [Physcomitrella patens]